MHQFHLLYCLNTPSLGGAEENKDTTSPTCVIFYIHSYRTVILWLSYLLTTFLLTLDSQTHPEYWFKFRGEFDWLVWFDWFDWLVWLIFLVWMKPLKIKFGMTPRANHTNFKPNLVTKGNVLKSVIGFHFPFHQMAIFVPQSLRYKHKKKKIKSKGEWIVHKFFRIFMFP